MDKDTGRTAAGTSTEGLEEVCNLELDRKVKERLAYSSLQADLEEDIGHSTAHLLHLEELKLIELPKHELQLLLQLFLIFSFLSLALEQL